MAYRITYEWQREQALTKKGQPYLGTVLGIFLVATALGVRILVPQTEQVFRELIHPLSDEYTISAFGEMVELIGEGTSVQDAVTAFCREIIEHGE